MKISSGAEVARKISPGGKKAFCSHLLSLSLSLSLPLSILHTLPAVLEFSMRRFYDSAAVTKGTCDPFLSDEKRNVARSGERPLQQKGQARVSVLVQWNTLTTSIDRLSLSGEPTSSTSAGGICNLKFRTRSEAVWNETFSCKAEKFTIHDRLSFSLSAAQFMCPTFCEYIGWTLWPSWFYLQFSWGGIVRGVFLLRLFSYVYWKVTGAIKHER